MRISVAIIEDDIYYNNALKKIIDHDDGLLCMTQYFSGEEALKHLADNPAEVILTDINLQDMTGIEVVSKLKPQLEDSDFIMCTSFEDDANIFNAMKAGATGYLRKGEPMEKIITAIKAAKDGGTPMSNGIARRVLQHFREVEEAISPELKVLTKSELEVLEILSTGKQYKEIAAEKYISYDTVKKHIQNIYRKLHVNNRTEAINKLKK